MHIRDRLSRHLLASSLYLSEFFETGLVELSRDNFMHRRGGPCSKEMHDKDVEHQPAESRQTGGPVVDVARSIPK